MPGCGMPVGAQLDGRKRAEDDIVRLLGQPVLQRHLLRAAQQVAADERAQLLLPLLPLQVMQGRGSPPKLSYLFPPCKAEGCHKAVFSFPSQVRMQGTMRTRADGGQGPRRVGSRHLFPCHLCKAVSPKRRACHSSGGCSSCCAHRPLAHSSPCSWQAPATGAEAFPLLHMQTPRMMRQGLGGVQARQSTAPFRAPCRWRCASAPAEWGRRRSSGTRCARPTSQAPFCAGSANYTPLCLHKRSSCTLIANTLYNATSWRFKNLVLCHQTLLLHLYCKKSFEQHKDKCMRTSWGLTLARSWHRRDLQVERSLNNTRQNKTSLRM